MSELNRLALVGVLSAVVWGLALIGVFAAVLSRLGRRTMSRPERITFAIAGLAALVELGCFLYGVLIEADQLDVQTISLASPKLKPGTRLRLAVISDLHVDRESPTLAKLIAAVREARPDLVVFTGDSVNDAAALPVFQRTLRQLEAPLGRFAVRGNHDVWYWSHLDLFGDGVATELRGDQPIPAGPINLCGAAYGQAEQLARCLHHADASAFTIVAYHTPDLIEDLAPRPDLYLAGHTHGGQVRAPFYGAIITLAKHGKKYEMGRYDVDGTTLYVNRGIGFEPHAPRVRFLAPPELTLIDVVAR